MFLQREWRKIHRRMVECQAVGTKKIDLKSDPDLYFREVNFRKEGSLD